MADQKHRGKPPQTKTNISAEQKELIVYTIEIWGKQPTTKNNSPKASPPNLAAAQHTSLPLGAHHRGSAIR